MFYILEKTFEGPLSFLYFFIFFFREIHYYLLLAHGAFEGGALTHHDASSASDKAIDLENMKQQQGTNGTEDTNVYPPKNKADKGGFETEAFFRLRLGMVMSLINFILIR